MLSDAQYIRKEAIKARNKINKRRSADMERRVMRKLKGHRVPMSGAGTLKGDGIVWRLFGMFLVECKLSSLESTTRGPMLRFFHYYVPKLYSDVKAMGAKFGVFAVHFMNHGEEYIIMNESTFLLLFPEVDRDSLHSVKGSDKASTVYLNTIKEYKQVFFKIPSPHGMQYAVGINTFIAKLDRIDELLAENPKLDLEEVIGLL